MLGYNYVDFTLLKVEILHQTSKNDTIGLNMNIMIHNFVHVNVLLTIKLINLCFICNVIYFPMQAN